MKEDRYLTIQLGSKSSLERSRKGETVEEWKERVRRSEAKKEAAEAKRERRRQRNLR